LTNQPFFDRKKEHSKEGIMQTLAAALRRAGHKSVTPDDVRAAQQRVTERLTTEEVLCAQAAQARKLNPTQK
jgi:hypothetical protein